MLNLKELVKIRSVIDEYVPVDDIETMEIREKLTDIIQVKKAWNIGKHVDCTIIS